MNPRNAAALATLLSALVSAPADAGEPAHEGSDQAGQSGYDSPSAPDVPGEVSAQRPAPPRHALSLSLTGLTGRALAVSYERPALASLLGDRYSLAGILGARRGAAGDYGSTHLVAAVELRRWLTGWSPGARYREPAMVGPYLGVRLALGIVRVKDRVDDEVIGRTLVAAETATIGYRFVIRDLVELTPSAGVQLRHDIELENRLSPLTHLDVTLGLTAGVLLR